MTISNSAFAVAGIAGGSPMVQLSTTVISSTVSNVTFALSGSYSYYQLVFNNLLNTSVVHELDLYISTNGGSTYIASGINTSLVTSIGPTYTNNNNGAFMPLSGTGTTFGIANGSPPTSGNILIGTLNNTIGSTAGPIISTIHYFANNSQYTSAFTTADWGGTAINFIKLQPSAGSVTGGNFILYGVV